MFEKHFTVILGTFRSLLAYASCSTWEDPKTTLAPLKKVGTGIKVPLIKGDLGGFRTFYTDNTTFQTFSNSNGKPVRSLAITTEVKSNDKPNIQPQVKSKVNLPTTNARSLASWVDEFCDGARDKEKDILI
ncbi:MAG: hypothetical protein V7K89_24290 [Nostoc sp.]|uniref:hypothetical protein n=1 Tax=Nostoc sp. TaxID=1180 RepID=UPI002FF4751C